MYTLDASNRKEVSMAAKMAAKFVLREQGMGSYLILFQTHNGQVLLTSEVQKYKDIALRRIHALRQQARHEKNYELRTETVGFAYFVIKDERGEVLGLSDMFTDPESLQSAMNQARGYARVATFEDLTVPPPRPAFRRARRA